MSRSADKPIDDFDEANAKALAEMLVDPQTSEAVRLQIINEILEHEGNSTFWETMFKEDMTMAECPHCKHKTHWLIPEEELNVMGFISADQDPRIHRHTSQDSCKLYAEACIKKKTTM